MLSKRLSTENTKYDTLLYGCVFSRVKPSSADGELESARHPHSRKVVASGEQQEAEHVTSILRELYYVEAMVLKKASGTRMEPPDFERVRIRQYVRLSGEAALALTAYAYVAHIRAGLSSTPPPSGSGVPRGRMKDLHRAARAGIAYRMCPVSRVDRNQGVRRDGETDPYHDERIEGTLASSGPGANTSIVSNGGFMALQCLEAGSNPDTRDIRRRRRYNIVC